MNEEVVTANISASQFREMHNAPILILPDVARKGYVINRFSMEFLTGSPFQGGGDIMLQYTNFKHVKLWSATNSLAKENLTSGGEGRILAIAYGKEILNGITTVSISGKGIYLTNDGAPFTGGSFGAVLNVWYSLINLT